MKFENTNVYNFKNALHGMRNPLNSWDKSDSYFDTLYENQLTMNQSYINRVIKTYLSYCNDEEEIFNWLYKNMRMDTNPAEYNVCKTIACIGAKDLKLAQQLIKAGAEHRKFLRQIFVSVDITAPIYW